MALTLLSIVLFNTVISLIGRAAISSLLYTIVFTYLLPNEQHKKQRALKREIIKNRTDLSNTSAQDDFAKWAKIRRKVDKQVAELEAMSEPTSLRLATANADELSTRTDASLASHRSSFDKVIKAVIFIGTTGLQWSFTTRHSRSAIVYLPKDWFGPLTWFLGLPFAPKGALGCTVFIMLVKRFIGIVTRIGKDIVLGVKGQGTEAPPVAVPVPAATSAKPSEAKEKKKE